MYSILESPGSPYLARGQLARDEREANTEVKLMFVRSCGMQWRLMAHAPATKINNHCLSILVALIFSIASWQFTQYIYLIVGGRRCLQRDMLNHKAQRRTRNSCRNNESLYLACSFPYENLSLVLLLNHRERMEVG